MPSRYFTFASRGITVPSLHAAMLKYGAFDTFLGFDAGNIPTATVALAKASGCGMSVYVEGPGGPTGTDWTPDERARVLNACILMLGEKATFDEIDTMKAWDGGVWMDYTIQQLLHFSARGCSMAEIDNISRVEPDIVRFLHGYGSHRSLPKLILKNLGEEDLKKVVDATNEGRIRGDIFAGIHISERGTGDRNRQDDISQQIGITTLPSNNTYDYEAHGEF